MPAASDELTLAEWLEATQLRRDELADYAKSALPADAGQRHVDIEKAIQNADDSGRLLADAETFLIQARAQAVLAIRKEYPDLSARERDLMLQDRVSRVQRLVDGIAVTAKSINTRIFAIQNANRSRL